MVRRRDRERIVEWRMKRVAASFLRAMPARIIHQDAPHHACGDGEKVRAVLPLRLVVAAEPKVHLVDQCRGLQRMPVAFPPQVVMSQAPQLVVDDGHKLFQRLRVPAAPLPKETSDLPGECLHSSSSGSIVPELCALADARLKA